MITKRRVLKIINDIARANAMDWTRAEWEVFSIIRLALRAYLPEAKNETPLEQYDRLIQVLDQEEANW